MMKKIIQAIMLTCLVILLTGCGQKEVAGPESSFIGGTQGLSIEFRQGMPPTEVWDRNTFPFDISVDLENKGEWTVNKTDVKVQLAGFNPATFSTTGPNLVKNSPETLMGLRKDSQGNILPATRTGIDFINMNYKDTLASDEQYNLLADLCYGYGTKATSKICIKQDLRDLNTRVCAINEDKEIKNSGAPVQIIELKESSAGQDQIVVTFKIQNQGIGQVYQLDSRCPQNLTAKIKKEDMVIVKIDSGLSVQPKCSSMKNADGTAKPEANEGYVKLINGEAIISCRQTAVTSTDFEQLVNFELKYDYQQTIQQPLLVKRSQ